MAATLRLTLIGLSEAREVEFTPRRLYCGGFTGRNQEAVNRHIEELAKLGVPRPGRTPALYHVTPYLLTCGGEIEVVGGETSGEAECVLLIGGDEAYITVGSDHTDRSLERIDFTKAKQVCSKIVAKQMWRLRDVEDHFDELILRSTVEKDGETSLYQEGPLGMLTRPYDLLNLHGVKGGEGMVLFSGTIPSKTGGLIYADRFRMELIDLVLKRRIEHTYRVNVI